MREEKRKVVITCLLIFVCFLFLWTTVINREIAFDNAEIKPFWSYIEWLCGNWNIGKQIMANILFFIPIGFMMSLLFDRKKYLVLPILFSCLVETLQMISMRGMFELDDIFNNSLGAIIGWIVGKRIDKKYFLRVSIFAAVVLGVLVFVTPISSPNIPRILCFQIDENGNGFGFRSGYLTPQNYSIILRNTITGEKRIIEAKTGIESDEVATYFGEEYRYSGIHVSVPDELCEIVLRYNPILQIPTNVYISSAGVQYYSDTNFSSPDFNAPFIANGVLRFYRPDVHCWVYQYEGFLYWVVDKNFYFEEDGTTHIEYQLWSSQDELLPQTRLSSGWNWDNIGGYFEDYEIQGDFGSYRVMKRELPTEYPITSIATGYYKNRKWIWREFFRPYYEFSQ